jgi:hypothetical protein
MSEIDFPNFRKVEMSLADIGSGTGEQPVTIVATPLGISIYAQGYGDNWSVEGRGIPIWIDYRDGDLRVYIHGNINSENPTHVISLANAREDRRLETTK